MKKITLKIGVLLLALCLLLPLSSCALWNSVFPEKEENTPFTVAAGGTAACRIVYPSGADATSWLGVANLLAKAINRLTGVVTSAVSDAESAEGAEILIGNTSRAASADAVSALSGLENAFSFSVAGKNLVIAAATPTAARLAVSYFEMQVTGTLGGTLGEGALSFPAALSVTSAAATGGAEPADLLQGAGMLPLQAGDDFALVGTGMTVAATALAGEKLVAALTTGKGTVTLVSTALTGGKVLATGEVPEAAGAVGMCYNPVLNLLVLLTDGGKTALLMDPATFAVCRTVTLRDALSAIAYDPARFCFVARKADNETFIRLDNSLLPSGSELPFTFDGSTLTTGTATFHAMEADSKNVYLLYGTEKDGANASVLVTLSYDGATRYLTDLPVAGTPAGLSRSGRIFYLATKEGEGAGSVTRLNIPPAAGIEEPSQLFTKENTAEADTSHLSSEFQFSAYAFIEEAYARNTVLQGACTDGTYGYFFMEYQGGSGNYANSETHDTVIVKVDMETGKLVKYSEPLKLGHSNDGCYNPRTGLIAISYCGKNGATGESLYDRACFVDPDTLELVGEATLPLGFYAIAYNEYTGQYVLARNGINFALLNEDFSLSRKVSTDFGETFLRDVMPGCTVGEEIITQGIDCDSKYVYYVLYCPGSPIKNYLVVFDYNGKYAFSKEVPGVPKEIENIFHIGNVIYVSYNGNYQKNKRPCQKLTVTD